jgi:hypothetical protein
MQLIARHAEKPRGSDAVFTSAVPLVPTPWKQDVRTGKVDYKLDVPPNHKQKRRTNQSLGPVFEVRGRLPISRHSESNRGDCR